MGKGREGKRSKGFTSGLDLHAEGHNTSDGAASPSRTGRANPNTKPLRACMHRLSIWAQCWPGDLVLSDTHSRQRATTWWRVRQRSKNRSVPCAAQPAGLTSEGTLEQSGWLIPVLHIAMHRHTVVSLLHSSGQRSGTGISELTTKYPKALGRSRPWSMGGQSLQAGASSQLPSTPLGCFHSHGWKAGAAITVPS